MHKSIKDIITNDFELLTQYIHDDELLTSYFGSLIFDLYDNPNMEVSYKNFCFLLMDMIVQKAKVAKVVKKNHLDEVCLLSDEEKYFLSSLYN